jgi:ubiquinone/menaquinone biosynthesis C-methylase UbiE
MTSGELLVRQEQCRRRLHAFQFYADNQNLPSPDRYFAIVMVEQEQDNIDDLRLLLERTGRIEQRRRMP